MTRLGLTIRQGQVLELIRAKLSAGYGTPSYDEIQAFMEWRSKSSVYRCVEALESKGYLIKGKGMARSIALAPGMHAYTIHPSSRLEQRLMARAASDEIAPEGVIVAALDAYLGGAA